MVDYETTAFYVESDTFDLCAGHSTTEGVYHYHSTPGCLQEQAIVEAGSAADEHSPVLGWSYVSILACRLLALCVVRFDLEGGGSSTTV